MSLLEISNLTIGPFNKFSLGFKANSFSIITGSNNSGKTLLIKVLSGLVSTKNKVLYNDKALENYLGTTLNKDIVVILDDFSFTFETVIDEIRYPLEQSEYDDTMINKLVKDIGKDMKITNILNKNIAELNFYEKIRVVLAANLVSSPKILLIDDPAKFLNRYEKEELVSIFNHLQTMGMTIIMTSSSLEETIYTVNSTLYILDNGKIISSGDIFEVLSNDSLINKAGLELPFMVDLSVKLKYYNLVDKIFLNPVRLVDTIWK
ncbi:MAG TPA: energy-coupling factor ABC transporter ATP-binding protein [Candidatus Onthousia faecavium]|nr:energy-coupling factor ABC transporter ATP-binding protein [Candidatus Onthousia faecavium]